MTQEARSAAPSRKKLPPPAAGTGGHSFSGPAFQHYESAVQLVQSPLSFLTPEEHYDYAVSQLNTGYFDEAREHFNRILGDHPQADYALYGLALLDSVTGRTQDCLKNLARAIELNPRNRLQARADNDFQSMVDDPRFTELLYPEVP
jgi:tetratricopeptide (TPR) repeat protein